MKAKTNVATARFIKRLSSPILGFQVKSLVTVGLIYSFLQPERDTPHVTMRVDKFDSDVFRQLMEFAHTGKLDLQPRTITGEQLISLLGQF